MLKAYHPQYQILHILMCTMSSIMCLILHVLIDEVDVSRNFAVDTVVLGLSASVSPRRDAQLFPRATLRVLVDDWAAAVTLARVLATLLETGAELGIVVDLTRISGLAIGVGHDRNAHLLQSRAVGASL